MRYCEQALKFASTEVSRSPELKALKKVQQICEYWISGNQYIGGGLPESAPTSDWDGILAKKSFEKCKLFSDEINLITPTDGYEGKPIKLFNREN